MTTTEILLAFGFGALVGLLFWSGYFIGYYDGYSSGINFAIRKLRE